MIIRTVKGKHLGQTSYILKDEKDAIIFDCGFDFAVVENYIKENSLNVLGIFLTHGHFDHAMSGAELLSKGYKIYASEHSDRLTLDGNDMAKYLGIDFTNFSVPNKLKDNDVVKLGNFEIKSLYTPGHTVDGMCYIINGIMFSGDTLLSGAYGRVDLPTANPEQMKSSLKRLLSLDKKMIVCSGHEHVSKGVNMFAPKRTLGDYACSQDIVYFLQNN